MVYDYNVTAAKLRLYYKAYTKCKRRISFTGNALLRLPAITVLLSLILGLAIGRNWPPYRKYIADSELLMSPDEFGESRNVD